MTPQVPRSISLRSVHALALLAGLAGTGTVSHADTPARDDTAHAASMNLSLLSPVEAHFAKPADQAAGAEVKPSSGKDLFVLAPSSSGGDRAWFLTLGAGVARDEDPGTHTVGFATISTFLDQGLEFQFELNGYAFQQPGDDAAGAGFHFNLRWHVWSGQYGEARQWWDAPMSSAPDWTVFFDGGIGMIFSTDDVPENGTSVNFSPRVGAGFTARLGESQTRLVMGVRWHHMSNARINGDDENPDFNAPLVFAGVQWGF